MGGYPSPDPSPPGGGARTVGLLGRRLGYSLSPAMHNAAFRALGLNCQYLTIAVEPEDLPRILEAMRRLDFLGANVTVPYKEAVIPLLDGLAPEAEACGSVNTIRKVEGRLWGHSTDGLGFVRACRRHCIPLEGAAVLLLGAGGAARAVAFALAGEGIASLAVVNRTLDRAVGLVKLLSGGHPSLAVSAFSPGDLPRETAVAADLVVNAASTPPAVPPGIFRQGQVLHDLVYSPVETDLMKAARAAGGTAVNGLAMLLFQAEASFTLWTGLEAPHSVMAAALPNGDRFI